MAWFLSLVNCILWDQLNTYYATSPISLCTSKGTLKQTRSRLSAKWHSSTERNSVNNNNKLIFAGSHCCLRPQVESFVYPNSKIDVQSWLPKYSVVLLFCTNDLILLGIGWRSQSRSCIYWRVIPWPVWLFDQKGISWLSNGRLK